MELGRHLALDHVGAELDGCHGDRALPVEHEHHGTVVSVAFQVHAGRPELPVHGIDPRIGALVEVRDSPPGAARSCRLRRRRCTRRRRGRDACELGGARRRTLVISYRPCANGSNQNLQIVDRGHERAREGRGPGNASIPQSPSHTLERRRELGEWRQLGHRRAAAQSAGIAHDGFGIRPRPRSARAHQNPVELLDVLARFENEEVEESGRCRVRHEQVVVGAARRAVGEKEPDKS